MLLVTPESLGAWELANFWKKTKSSRKGYNQHLLETPPTTGIRSNDYFKNFQEFYSQKTADNPFVFWFGSYEPHRVYEYQTGVKAGKSLNKVSVPKFLPDNEVVRNDVLDYILEIEHFDNHLLQMIQFLEKKGN